MTKNVLILTGLPFRTQGNQSLIRFVQMFLNKGYSIELYTSGFDERGENNLTNCALKLNRFTSLEQYLVRAFKKKKEGNINKKKTKPSIKKQNFYQQLSSQKKISLYGVLNLKRAAISWMRWGLNFIDNLRLFFTSYKVTKEANLIIAYESSYVFAAKWLSRLYRKPFINKYQGLDIIHSFGGSFKEVIHFFPEAYFNLIPADLTIIVNDGSQGYKYAHRKRCKNVLFIEHGVGKKDYENINLQQFDKIINGRFCVVNIASASISKRVDRFIRVLASLDPSIQEKVIFISTYFGSDLEQLKELTKFYDVDGQIEFISALNHIEANALLQRADVLVSVNEAANLGNPVLEALYYRTPVIAINDDSTTGILRPELDGWLVDLDENFDKNMARKIEELVMCPEKIQAIKSSAQNQVFSLEVQQEKEWRAIQTVLEDEAGKLA